MNVTLNPGQLAALKTIAAGEPVARFVAANLRKRGMVTDTPDGAALTTDALDALADAARAVCHDGRCALARHEGDHVDAGGYRFLNFDDASHWYYH